MEKENNAVEVFKNEEFGEVRTTMVEGEPWFVAADVCKALEIGNPSQAVSRLDNDEKQNTLISNEGNKGNPNVVIINEAGLYSMIISSRKPEAKAFKRWITHEVIPSIRKHGAYMTPQKLYECLQDPRAIANILNALADEQDKNKELANENAALNATIEEQQPKVEFADHVLESRNAVDMSDFSKIICKNGIMLGRNNLFKKLRQLHILMDTNIPYQRYIDNGWFVVVEFTYHQGNTPYVGAKTLVTGKGQIALVKKLRKVIEEEKELTADA